MGYLIAFAVRDGMLQAAVRGRTGGAHARRIARDISEEADRGQWRRVLIDLRGVADRLGSLGELSLSRVGGSRMRGCRVAVVDARENDPYYALHEMAAAARGCVLKCFSSAADASRWLRSAPGLD
jgi:hypothetical protein